MSLSLSRFRVIFSYIAFRAPDVLQRVYNMYPHTGPPVVAYIYIYGFRKKLVFFLASLPKRASFVTL